MGQHDIVVVQWENINYQVQIAPILAIVLIFALSVWLAILRTKNSEAEAYLSTHSVHRNGSLADNAQMLRNE